MSSIEATEDVRRIAVPGNLLAGPPEEHLVFRFVGEKGQGGVLDGDFVIVHRQESAAAGDLVVLGGEPRKLRLLGPEQSGSFFEGSWVVGVVVGLMRAIRPGGIEGRPSVAMEAE